MQRVGWRQGTGLGQVGVGRSWVRLGELGLGGRDLERVGWGSFEWRLEGVGWGWVPWFGNSLVGFVRGGVV